MLESRRLALYCFLTEIGACDDKLMVFEDNPQPSRYDISYVLEAALSTEVAGLIQNMLIFLECRDRRYFLEQALVIAAHEYMRLPWVDNTFRDRFIELDAGRPLVPGDDDLPF